jgi:hypothetical protein
MELRYMGFDQTQDKRFYKFDHNAKGQPATRLLVSVDMALFLKHHVGIQEGPALCAQKLAADLEAHREGGHALTNEDLLAYATDRAAKEAQKAEARRPSPHRRPSRPPGPV